MFGAIITIICIVAVLLVLVVLIQNPKGGGISGEFGGAGASQMFGVQRTGDILEQLTWGGAIVIVLLSLASKFITPAEAEGINSVNVEKAATKTIPAAVPAPAPATTPAPAATPNK